MNIAKLRGKNFRTLEGEFDIPLDGIINLFYADNNGTGKTSALYAFLFLVANYVHGKTIDEYINWNSDSMELETEFSSNGKTFSIMYTNIKGKADKTLKIDEEEFSGVSVCNKKLKEYFDPSLFIPSVFIEQNAKNFTSIKPSERRDNLKKIFNIDYTPEIKELEIEERELKNGEVATLEKTLIIEKSKKFEQSELLKQHISEDDYKENKSVIESLAEKIATLSSSIKEVDTQKELLKTRTATFNRAKLKLDSDTLKLKELDEKLETLSSFEDVTSTLDSLKEQLGVIKLERVKPFDTSILNETVKEIGEVRSDIRSLEKKLKDCASGVCPTCGKDFISNDTESVSEEVTRLKLSLEQLTETQEQQLEEKSTTDDLITQNESKKRDKQLLESKIESEENRISREREINTKEIKQCEESLQSIGASITEGESTIQTLGKEIDAIEVRDVSDIEADVINKRTLKLELESRCSQYDSIEIENKLIVKNNTALLVEEKESAKLVKKTEGKLEQLAIQLQQLGKMRRFLKNEFPSYVVASMVQQIEHNMNDFINKVYYRDLGVEISMSDDTIDVLYGDGEKKVDAVNASGAEESLLALSYCYSLNKLKGYDLLLMDEVDSSFTQEAAESLAAVVLKIKEEYGFIGIVSHVDSVKDLYEMEGANMIKMENVC